MIVCHSHQFIFVKPRKVAGTTIELKLSSLLNAGDLATPIEPEEEILRECRPGVIVAKIKKNRNFCISASLRDHSTLQKAYSILGKKVKNYMVVSACRNPWDRAVSQFFWSYRKRNILDCDFEFQKNEFKRFTKKYGPKTWLDQFYGRKRQRRLNSSHLYSLNNKIVSDFMIRFESLEKDILALVRTFKLPSQYNAKLFDTKSVFRPQYSKKWQKFYDDETIELVAKCCADEIKYFNYNFEGTSKPVGQFLKNRPGGKL